MFCPKIKKSLIAVGALSGTPCTLIDFTLSETDKEVDSNFIISKVLDTRLKNVLIRGSLLQENEIRTIATGLSSKGKLVTCFFDANEPIETLRTSKGIRFVLTMTPPNSKENNVNQNNFPILIETDEVVITVKTLEEYEDAKSFIQSKTILRPTIIFTVNSEEEEVIRVIFEKFLEDAEGFKCRVKFI